MKVESFELDHTTVKAPYVRKCGLWKGNNGDIISKFDFRICQPNVKCLPTGTIHALEHLMAFKLRDYIADIVDISPMGCRTGFYITIFDDVDEQLVLDAINKTMEYIFTATEVPAQNEKQCGNYKDMLLGGAQGVAFSLKGNIHTFN